MSRRRFQNVTPIDDTWVVLDLLCRRWQDNTTREIIRYFPEDGPYVEIGHHWDFSDSRYFRFRVSDRIVDHLLASGYVVGTPEWGYTDMKKLCASDLGQHQLWHERSRLEMPDLFCSQWWYEQTREVPLAREAQAPAPSLSPERTG
jgi:hypothetical protein